jgi:hypothetical protein
VQYIELSILVRRREADRRKASKETRLPTLLLENGTSAKEAPTIAATVGDFGYLRMLEIWCLSFEGPPCCSAKTKKECGRKE